MTQRRGIRRIPLANGKWKWQAYVRIRGRLRTKTFAPATTETVMRRWREEQKIRARLGAELPTGETLKQAIADYLDQVRTMPTLKWRRADLDRWLRVFGPDRIRRSITAGEIRAQLEAWRAEGYAASTVNHRRTALMHLWTVLDGKSAPNPARDVPRYREPVPPPRSLSRAAVALLLEAMPPSQTRARLALMAWTGWPHSQIARLEPSDIAWDQSVAVKPRRKGQGAAGATLPLLPEGWTALREVRRTGAWGAFSASSARKSLRLAAKKARRTLARAWARREIDRAAGRRLRLELMDVTPYQLRHSFLTLIATISRDDRAVQALGQHADIRTSHRYTRASVDPRTAAALAKVAEALQKHTL